MNAPAEIIDRIKKLLRLARSSNQHEAQQALARAMALAAEHRIAVDSLNPDAVAPSVTHQDTETFARLSYDRKYAALIVKRFFRVTPITCWAIHRVNGWPKEGAKVSFVGTPSDIEIALYVYHFLVRHFAYCWKKHRGRLRNRYSFVEGMFQGLWCKLTDAEPPAAARVTTGTELALSVNGYIAEHIGKTEQTRMPAGTASAARWAGFVQGQKTQINPAIKTGAAAPLALT